MKGFASLLPGAIGSAIRAAFWAIFWAAFWPSGGPAFAGVMATHRAVYALALDPLSGGTDLTGVEGIMTYEWADACKGWTTAEKADLKLFYQDGHQDGLGWTLNSWEAKDGLSYRFLVRDFTGDKQSSELEGEATLRGPGEPGIAHFTKPTTEAMALPAGTLFPTAHSDTLLRHLAAGDRQFYATVFDGTDDKQLFQISAVLSSTLKPSAEDSRLSPLLAEGPIYRLGLAFYGAHAESSTPDQEQTVDLYANGIIDKLTLDYGDFTVDAVLKTLEAVPSPGC
ncbi:MAG TPA: DUF1849 family protein [Candidatus Udaeobacter sp.]|nr:DUF1849 family protein [Candidatus Udaeobacter sp.]